MKAHFSIVSLLLLITINSFSQVTVKRAASTRAQTPVVNVGGVKQTLIPKQIPANRTLLIPIDTANAQMSDVVVEIAFSSPYQSFDVLGRYNLQIFLLNENNIEIARWNFNRNKPNESQDLNATNDGYYHVQLPLEIENSKAASTLGSFKKGATLKFFFDHSFQNIAYQTEDYFFINSFTITLKFQKPSFNTVIWPGNDAEQKYTAGHKSSVFNFYWDGSGLVLKQ